MNLILIHAGMGGFKKFQDSKKKIVWLTLEKNVCFQDWPVVAISYEKRGEKSKGNVQCCHISVKTDTVYAAQLACLVNGLL